jgi:hypothetical protein
MARIATYASYTHIEVYRNGKLERSLGIYNKSKVDKNRFIKAMFNEVTKAAYANPHNTYYIQLRRYDE